jgi:hypothetical protein
MRRLNFKGNVAVLAALAVWAGTSASAFADLTLNLTTTFSGSSPASSTQPWVQAVLHDNGDGTVNLTISTPNLSASENIDGFYLNFNSSLDVTKLSFTGFTVNSGTVNTPTPSTGANGFKADGDGFYDIKLAFTPGGTAGAFGAGESVTYTISSSQGNISSLDFDFFSSPGGGAGTWAAAAHIQNTVGGVTSDSGWIGAVPEPSTVIAGALLLLPFGASAVRIVRRNRGA